LETQAAVFLKELVLDVFKLQVFLMGLGELLVALLVLVVEIKLQAGFMEKQI